LSWQQTSVKDTNAIIDFIVTQFIQFARGIFLFFVYFFIVPPVFYAARLFPGIFAPFGVRNTHALWFKFQFNELFQICSALLLGPLSEGAVSEADWGSALQSQRHSLRLASGDPPPSKREARGCEQL